MEGIALRLVNKVSVPLWVVYDKQVHDIASPLERASSRLVAGVVQRKSVDF